MQQFNYPTTILYGEGSVKETFSRIKSQGYKHPLVVTDQTLVKIGISNQIIEWLNAVGLKSTLYDGVHPNPIEADVREGTEIYKKNACDCLIALGGGSPMDAAKVIMLLINHHEPIEVYDDTKGGDKKITNPMPPLFAIPTTAGTGSEVGRSGVIILEKTNDKTIFFHPSMLPKIAALEPSLTTGLPAPITAATGIDAFTHCLEAYFAPSFHPMADGIALEGIRLILKNLPIAIKDGKNIESRAKMLLSGSMGATAFQKGLGMIHSLAHPLSSECGLHHGFANALMLPKSIEFIETQNLNQEQKTRFARVMNLFDDLGLAKNTLSKTCYEFIKNCGVQFGLKNHGVKESQIELLSDKAFKDPCHQNNMLPVTRENLKHVYTEAFL